MIDLWVVIIHLSPRRGHYKFTGTDCEEWLGEEGEYWIYQQLKGSWAVVRAVSFRGHSAGRGRGDFSVTQMCRADRNSG